MYKICRNFISLLTLCVSISANAESPECYSVKRMDPDQLRNHMVQVSIARYTLAGGACPCPYSLSPNGYGCGADSAYTRSHHKHPLCYTHDISVIDMNKFKASVCGN